MPGKNEIRRFLIYVHDLTVTTAAFPISLLLRENFELSNHHFQPILYGSTLILIIAIFVFQLTGLQRGMWRYTSHHDLLSILKTVSLILGIFVSIMFLFDRLNGVPRSIIAIYWLVAVAGLAGSRIVYGCIMPPGLATHSSAVRHAPQRALVLGDLAAAVTIIQKVRTLHAGRLRIVGVISENAESGRSAHGAAILGNLSNFKEVIALLEAQGLTPKFMIVADPIDVNPALQLLAERHNIQLVSAVHLDKLKLLVDGEIEYQPLFHDRLKGAGYLRIKRFVETVLALCALTAVLPLLAMICVLSLITLGSPILFTQCRAGQHMREFFLLKIRTMRNAFDTSGRILNDADRTSHLGSFLRTTRLDELPQLWNVINGDMALIGPRPLLLRDLPKDEFIVRARYSVRPGLTGWAQVNGGKLLSHHQKMALDLYYVRNVSFLLDMKILALTVPMILFGERVNTNAIERAHLTVMTR